MDIQQAEKKFLHMPVMLSQVLKMLDPVPGGFYVDGTVGGGGHAEAILLASDPSGRLLGIDRDGEALTAAAGRLRRFGERARLEQGNFAEMARMAGEPADGILLDVGVSSYQLDNPQRGFSYRQDAPLDMRMDAGQGLSAADILNTYDEEELSGIFFRYGEEKWAKRIAQFVVRERAVFPILQTGHLVEVIKQAIPVGAREKDQHPARRVFQALRIAVNDELGALEKALHEAAVLLKPGGRLAVITFHSLEDRLVKEVFRWLALDCVCPPRSPVCQCGKKAFVKVLTKKPLLPEAGEIEANPRARSAKMRVAEKF
ncbi:MAG: 16S rRNA (cytosine(1402)-N(4))-methyltransferase RsmH [Clostridiales bacterium]|nr:16S rRNA (cytosine(1402)-N(4))-methyltransferase RsmH [Clostridiales bacterium]